MVNHFDIVREFRKQCPGIYISYAVRVGNKLLHIEHAFQELTSKKIQFISQYLISRGVRIRFSKTSESIYFSIRGIRFRISDHPSKNEFVDHNIVIRHDSCVVQQINFIHLCAFKLEL